MAHTFKIVFCNHKIQTMAQLSSRILHSIHDLSSADWDAVVGDRYPFLKHAFLSALEDSGSVSPENGWVPNHLAVSGADGALVAVAVAYLKDHSYGEYVFDWSWAHAYQQNRMRYYPKLVTAIPFTPCTGPRLCVSPTVSDDDRADVYRFCIDELIKHAKIRRLSSWHILFPEEGTDASVIPVLNERLMMRSGSQYHWYNPGYKTFADYLGDMKARKRNSIRKERDKVSQQGIEFVHLKGNEMSADMVGDFYIFYHATYMKRGQYGYLNREFFEQLVATMPENLLFVFARKGEANIAAAMFFVGADTIFGRYWGCLDEYDQLHFETCYYQGIEFAIANQLDHFDSGAQGEHKIQRGFRPIETRSWHWIADPGFADAIDDFVHRERPQILAYIKDAERYLPFKNKT